MESGKQLILKQLISDVDLIGYPLKISVNT